MGENGKYWSLSRIGNTRCRDGGTIAKRWKKNKLEGDVKMVYDTIIPAFVFLAIVLIIYWRGQKC